MLKLGIIGCGAAGRMHMDSYLQIPEIHVEAVNDIDVDRAKAFQNQFNVKALILDELIASVDIVDIASPAATHIDIVRKAALMGKDIICETPIARTLGDAEEIINICKVNNVKLIPVHFIGFAGPYLKVKEKVQKGQIGSRGMIRITRKNAGIPESANEWRNVFSQSGGVVLDLLLQDIAFLNKNIGPISRVFCNSTRKNGAAQGEYALASLGFENGSIAHLEGSWLEMDNGCDEFEFAYKNGLITFSERTDAPLRVTINNECCSESPVQENIYDIGFKEIFKTIKSGEALPVTQDDAFEALRVALAIIESANTGDVVVLK
jgi:predicted dehydrogenase